LCKKAIETVQLLFDCQKAVNDSDLLFLLPRHPTELYSSASGALVYYYLSLNELMF